MRHFIRENLIDISSIKKHTIQNEFIFNINNTIFKAVFTRVYKLPSDFNDLFFLKHKLKNLNEKHFYFTGFLSADERAKDKKKEEEERASFEKDIKTLVLKNEGTSYRTVDEKSTIAIYKKNENNEFIKVDEGSVLKKKEYPIDMSYDESNKKIIYHDYYRSEFFKNLAIRHLKKIHKHNSVFTF